VLGWTARLAAVVSAAHRERLRQLGHRRLAFGQPGEDDRRVGSASAAEVRSSWSVVI
jgi:hypothetical protein